MGDGGGDGEPMVMGGAGEPTNLLAPKTFLIVDHAVAAPVLPRTEIFRYFRASYLVAFGEGATRLFWEHKGSSLRI